MECTHREIFVCLCIVCACICTSQWCILAPTSALLRSESCLLTFFPSDRPTAEMAEKWRGIWIGRFGSISNKFTSFFFFTRCPSYCWLYPVGDLCILVCVLTHFEVNLRFGPRENSLLFIKVLCWLGQNFVPAVFGISGAWISDMLSLGAGHLAWSQARRKWSCVFWVRDSCSGCPRLLTPTSRSVLAYRFSPLISNTGCGWKYRWPGIMSFLLSTKVLWDTLVWVSWLLRDVPFLDSVF